MTIKKTTSGKRFDFDKCEEVCRINFSHDDHRGTTLFKTASGNYIVQSWSHWQGEKNTFDECTIDEAKGYALDNLSWQEAITLFPDLQTDFADEI